MIAKIKLYVILGVVVAVVGLSIYYLKTYSFVKNSEVKGYKKRITHDSLKINYIDSLAFSIQQDLDICKANDTKLKIVIAEQKKQLSEALAEAKRDTEAIENYEKNGLMRYFVEDKRFLKKPCYKEVFEKPENICK